MCWSRLRADQPARHDGADRQPRHRLCRPVRASALSPGSGRCCRRRRAGAAMMGSVAGARPNRCRSDGDASGCFSALDRALMVYLAALGGIGLSRSAISARGRDRSLAAQVTVQVPANLERPARDRAGPAAASRAGCRRPACSTPAETARLLEPWLGPLAVATRPTAGAAADRSRESRRRARPSTWRRCAARSLPRWCRTRFDRPPRLARRMRYAASPVRSKASAAPIARRRGAGRAVRRRRRARRG